MTVISILSQAEIDTFLNSIRIRPRTRQIYRDALQRFCLWSGGFLPVADLQAQAFVQFREGQGRSPSTVAIDAYALRRYLAWKGISMRRLERSGRLNRARPD